MRALTGIENFSGGIEMRSLKSGCEKFEAHILRVCNFYSSLRERERESSVTLHVSLRSLRNLFSSECENCISN